jgi:AraC-like DNA-binding protein
VSAIDAGSFRSSATSKTSPLVRSAPGPRVSPYVVGYAGYEEVTGVPTRQREPMSTNAELIFGLDSEIEVDGRRLGTFVGGLSDECPVIVHDGAMSGVQVDARRLDGASAPPPDVAWAWNRLRATHGRARVSELAATLCCSRKHLAARFREHVGLPPKLVARTMRFRRAVDLLPSRPLDEIVFECGYYDQSHLDRDFREFAGTTPTHYRSDPRAPVTFFQDA